MKSTGVVRRVDDLGRIVIPKEIRRTLRIRDGESLEIFVDREMIALKKFSKMTDMDEISKQLVDIVNSVIGQNVFITDRDNFIAASGNLKKKYLGKPISKSLEIIMKDRVKVVEKELHNIEFLDSEMEQYSYIISPVIMNGDAIGLVLIISEQNVGQVEEKMADVVSKFLGKHIDE